MFTLQFNLYEIREYSHELPGRLANKTRKIMNTMKGAFLRGNSTVEMKMYKFRNRPWAGIYQNQIVAHLRK